MRSAGGAGVDRLKEGVFARKSPGNKKKVVRGEFFYPADNVVIASGAKLRKLGIPGEAEFEGKGVSQCADCDGPMYQNEVAVVVGGGVSALQESMVLAQYCKEVRLVHRDGAFSGSDHLQQTVNAERKIIKTFNAEVTA